MLFRSLLFINSWCQVPENFFVRGGLDVLEAFAILHKRYPQLRLTMRTALPSLADHYHRILEDGWVRVVHRYMTAEEMADLHAESHIFLLPAARVHIVSLLQAMSYGLAVVASDLGRGSGAAGGCARSSAAAQVVWYCGMVFLTACSSRGRSFAMATRPAWPPRIPWPCARQ